MKENLSGGLRSLSDCLEFAAPSVVKSFLNTFSVSEEEAEELFVQVKKWLWLGRYHELEGGNNGLPFLLIFESMEMVDEMWHEFFSHVDIYTEFCETYLGKKMIHLPCSIPSPLKVELDKLTDQDLTDLFKETVLYVTRLLGRETANLWYRIYLARYPRATVAALHKTI